MRRFFGKLIGVVTGLVAGLAAGLPALAAACGGTDQMAALQVSDPAGYAEVQARAAKVRNGEGIFWKVEKGAAAPSYLFGTFHDTGVAAEPLDAGVAAALEGARLMLVEITLDEQARMQQRMLTDPAFLMGDPGVEISSRLDPAQQARAQAALATRGLSLALADRMRPALLLSVLAQPQCALDALASGKPVLDTVLMQRAGGAGVPVAGLETYEAALASIDTVDREVLAKLLIEAVQNLDDLEDFRTTAIGLYRKGEMGALQMLEVWQAEQDVGASEAGRLYGALMDKVVDERNEAWLPVMLPEMEQGGVFAAFGAMHLVGDRGVVALLRERGYTVTRLDG